MGKQYTFKLTLDTNWLQVILDELESNRRSKFIREAIIEKLQREVPRQDIQSIQRLLQQDILKLSQADKSVTKDSQIPSSLPLSSIVMHITNSQIHVSSNSDPINEGTTNMSASISSDFEEVEEESVNWESKLDSMYD